jgi:hypothetical protein
MLSLLFAFFLLRVPRLPAPPDYADVPQHPTTSWPAPRPVRALPPKTPGHPVRVSR